MDEVMHDSMIPYAEHVILERALPRVEDGLKPVQRRILYTMLELGLSPDKPHRKSARIVGDCLGKYHPHGDSSVYEAMVHMAQPFAMSLPLVDGHGNFGSIDGDTAAAMRYTEARMTDAAMQLLRDIDLDTVDYSLNFDDTLKEPDLLPGRFPNLLINGAAGIAVGLATNIPPHNPGEAIDAAVAMIDDPKISLKKLMEIMPAPDFPTGGYLIDSPEIAAAYETGRGKLTMRAKTHFEQLKNGKGGGAPEDFGRDPGEEGRVRGRRGHPGRKRPAGHAGRHRGEEGRGPGEDPPGPVQVFGPAVHLRREHDRHRRGQAPAAGP